MKRKLTALILATLCAVGSAFSLSACNIFGNQTETEGEPDPSGEQPDNTGAPPMTFEEFIENYKSVAVKFFEDYVHNGVVEEREVQAEKWYINDKDGDNKVESASMSFIYNTSETGRAVQVANVTFNPIDVQDIVDGKVTSVEITVASEDVFTFDAKECYQNQDIGTALYNGANINSDTKLFYETAPGNGLRQFVVLEMADTNIKTTYVATAEGDGSKETLLYNLENAEVKTLTKSTTTLEGASLYSSAYTLEKFEEEPPKDSDDPVPPEPPVTVTNAEIISALNENCMDKILNATVINGKLQSTDNITNGTWYLTTNTDDNITKAEYAYTYQNSTTSAYYVITEVNFETPLTSNDIKNGEIAGTATNTFISKNYNTSIQDSYKDLTKAICNKAFGENNTATRYIIDAGGDTDKELGITRHFTVIQIVNGNVKEASITIKNDEAGYVANVNNGNHKEITYGKSYNLSGEKVVA